MLTLVMGSPRVVRQSALAIFSDDAAATVASIRVILAALRLSGRAQLQAFAEGLAGGRLSFFAGRLR
jgi:hypothetical protein